MHCAFTFTEHWAFPKVLHCVHYIENENKPASYPSPCSCSTKDLHASHCAADPSVPVKGIRKATGLSPKRFSAMALWDGEYGASWLNKKKTGRHFVWEHEELTSWTYDALWVWNQQVMRLIPSSPHYDLSNVRLFVCLWRSYTDN